MQTEPENVCLSGATGSGWTAKTTRTTPAVLCGPAWQGVFVDLVVSGLASMYPVSSWSCFAPDHHGYQRACVLISGQASTGHSGHQCSHAPGRPILHLFLFLSQTSGWKLLIALRHRLLLISPSSFVRPRAVPSSRPADVDRVARRGGQGRPSRLACGWLRRCQAAP